MSDNNLIAAEVISAYVTNNPIPASELPDLIRAVVVAFDKLGQPQGNQEAAAKPEPAVSVKKSVHHDHIVSLEDGKRYQTLKRHLSALGMTPDEYRAKWGLAADYPMTSAAYSEKRSEMSKALGLGKKKPIMPVEAPAKVRKPRPQPTAIEAPAKAPESVQEAAEAPPAVEARSNTMAPVEVGARSTPSESPIEPAEAQQEAA